MHYKTIYIGVNYKTPDQTIIWAKFVLYHDKEALVVIADNSADNNRTLPKMIKALDKDRCVYVDTGSNLGYFNGAAYALDIIKEDHTFDWLAVSNVDLYLSSNDPSKYLAQINGDVAAPAIISKETCKDKNPYRINRTSRRDMEIKRAVFRHGFVSDLYGLASKARNKVIMEKQQNVFPSGTEIYLPYGACIFFKNTFFERGGEIRYPLFLFGEEMYVAEQCHKYGLKIQYVPEIRFLNMEHASTGHLRTRTIAKRNYEAVNFILDKYYD